MKTGPSLLILLVLMFTLQANNGTWNQVRQMSHMQCRVFYFIETSNSSSFSWIKCIDDYYGGQVITDWTQCLSQCCSSQQREQYQTPSLEAIDKCEQWNNNPGLGFYSIFGIVLGIMVGVACLLICCCFCISRWREARNNDELNRRRVAMTELHLRSQPAVPFAQKFAIINNVKRQIVWLGKDDENQLVKSDSPCTICLFDTPITTAVLPCKHQFHPKCISEWLNKMPECPNCRRKATSGIMVYCQTCRKSYFNCTRTLLSQNRHNTLKCGCSSESNQKLQVSRNMLKQSVDQNELNEYPFQ